MWPDHGAGHGVVSVTAPNVDGVCSPWVEPEAVKLCADCGDLDLNDADVLAVVEDAIDVASGLLWALSGRQFSGECEYTVRPCRRSATVGYEPYAGWLDTWAESWGYFGSCGCHSHPERASCSCGGLSQITLGSDVVSSVSEVKINGAVLDPTAYRVDDYRWLVRIDGEHWPCCQDLTKDDTEADTWSVSYLGGVAPPAAGRWAAASYACELAKSRLPGAGECQLPKRLQAITRQGVNMLLLDPMSFLDVGRTGVYDVDSFIAAYNPAGLVRRPSVLSPDIKLPVITTG